MKILCFGDSNTFGYDPRSYFGSQYPAHHRWVDLLAAKLDCEAVNAGEKGRAIPGNKRLREDFRRILAKAEPIDLLVIMLGTNDLLQDTSPEATAKRMEIFLNHIPLEKSQILLIGPPPMKMGEWVPYQALVEASEDLCHRYNALAQKYGVDYAEARDWNVTLTFDGVHFTEEGHRAFAEGLQTIYKKENNLCWKSI